MTDIFRENLRLLSRFAPIQADLLAALPSPSAHEQRKPAQGSYKSITANTNLCTLFIYGISAQGEEYLHLLKWLRQNQERTAVFLLDDLAIARMLMETSVATQMLKDPQVLITCFSWPMDGNWEQFRNVFLTFYEKVSMQHFGLAPKFAPTPEESSRLHILYLQFQDYIDWHQRLYRAKTRGRSKFIDSYYLNLLELLNARFGHGMAGAFKNIPAIICGAGPSINQHLDRLRTLQERALIFGAGTGMNVLSRHGIVPHFGCGFDPTPTQLSRVSTNFAFQTPFFYTNSFNHEALRLLQGEKIAIREGATPFAPDWFDEQLGIPIGPQVSSGATTSNHCFDIACFLGCNPIILTGIDLCYHNDTLRYAPGVTAHPAEEARHHRDIQAMKLDLVKAKGLDGTEVTTAKHWLLEANCFIDSAKAYPEITVWNATEGGMPIKGIPNISLQEVAESDLKQTYDLDAHVHASIQRHGMEFIDRSKLQAPLERWRDSLVLCRGTLTNLLKDLQSRYHAIKTSPSDKTANYFTVDLDELLKGNPAYDYCLKLVDDTFLENNRKYMFRIEHFPEKFPLPVALKVLGDIEVRRCIYLLASLEKHLSQVEDTLKQLPAYPMLPRSTSHAQRQELVETVGGDQPNENICRLYYISGELYAIKRYRSRFLHGIQAYYFTDGSPRTLLNYHDGRLDGEAQLFYPTGMMKRQLHFLKGKLHGVEKMWNEAGLLVREAHYLDNTPTGTARSWHRNGILAREITYQDDSNQQMLVEWDESGKETKREMTTT